MKWLNIFECIKGDITYVGSLIFGVLAIWSEHDLKFQYNIADVIEPELRPEPDLTANEASVEIGEEAVLLSGTAATRVLHQEQKMRFLPDGQAKS